MPNKLFPGNSTKDMKPSSSVHYLYGSREEQKRGRVFQTGETDFQSNFPVATPEENKSHRRSIAIAKEYEAWKKLQRKEGVFSDED